MSAAMAPPAPLTREPWLATAMRMLVHGITAVVFTWPLADSWAVAAAMLGAGLGALMGRVVAGWRVRLGVILGADLLLAAGVWLVHGLLADATWFAAALGPEVAAQASDAWLFLGAAFVVSGGLRAVSSRFAAFSVLEVAAVGLAFADLVAAHRYGAINRPFEIADPILTRGGDPTVVMVVVGGAALFTIVLFLLSERSVLRSVMHMAVLAALLVGGAMLVYQAGMPSLLKEDDPLGLRGKRPNSKDDDKQGDGKSKPKPNEELEFRDNYDQPPNPPPVALVQFHDDYSPPFGMYYFRQGAFSQFNGTRLVQATRSDVDRDLASTFPYAPMAITDAPLGDEYRATLDTTVGLLTEHTRPFGLEAPVAMSPSTNPDPRRFKRVYRVTSASVTADYRAMIGLGAGAPTWDAAQKKHYTDGPADPRYGELARKIVSETLPPELQTDPMAQALAVTTWLGKNGKYSLRSRHANASDPTADFLFGDITGYCVHFAHAGVFLMRALGLPARVATGYAMEEAARQGGSALLLTGAASHAWPEIYIEGVGWVVTDVAPATVLSSAPPPPDPDLQRLLAELMRGEKPLADDGIAREDFTELFARYRALALRWLGGGLLGLLTFLFGAKILRRIRPWFAKAESQPKWAYLATLDRLSDLGVRRQVGETREAFARRAAVFAPSFVVLTDAHVGQAFGVRLPGDAGAKAVASQVHGELRASHPLWRRAVGILLPWTWLQSR